VASRKVVTRSKTCLLEKYTVREITGILQEQPESSVADVEFTFREEFAERGQRFAKTRTNWPNPGVGKGVAKLKRFDHGWRLEDLKVTYDQ